MMRLVGGLLSLACLVLIGGCPPIMPADSSGTPQPGDSDGGTSVAGGSTSPDLSALFPGCDEPTEAAAWRDEVWRLLNQERTSRGLSALSRDPVLEAQAERYACELIYYDFFAHENPVTGSNLAARADEFEYEYYLIGENLAAGQRVPVEAVRDWMASPSHRDNILHPRFAEVGIGVRIGGDYGVYWVTEFGTPLASP